MIVAGIDPGITGGLAAVGDLSFLGGRRMPTIQVGSKTIVDAHEVERFLEAIKPELIVIEEVAPMQRRGPKGPVKMGATSSFAFGRALGAVEAVAFAYVADLGGSVRYVTPAVWKRWAHLKADKRAAIARATAFYPGAAKDYWPRLADDGVAEAALIATFGRERYGRT